jgi:hypothetical protein
MDCKTAARKPITASSAESEGPGADSVRLPHAYALAAFVATRTEAQAIIHIGGRANPDPMALPGVREISIGLDQILNRARPGLQDGIWTGTDVGNGQPIQLDAAELDRSVVVCANVIEHVPDPSALLSFFSDVARRAHALIITTPDRDEVRLRAQHADPARVCRWNSAEFERLLRGFDLQPTFQGLTFGSIDDAEKDTILVVLDRCLPAAATVPGDFRPLAIIATYNDQDLILQIVSDLLDDGIDVHILDNWSTDETFEYLTGLSTSRAGLTLERFPAAGPTQYCEWHALLERKEEVAAQFPNRWVLHQDSDELRRSPWPGVSLRAGLYIAERMGFNAIDFSVCNFRSIDETFAAGMHPESALPFFEFGNHPAHFRQVRAWRQGEKRVVLGASGGHEAEFTGKRTFPYKFLLKHYPLRSSAQGRRKVADRRRRYSPQELAMGWHDHYNGLASDASFTWQLSDLIEFEERETRRKYLTELIAGIGIARD